MHESDVYREFAPPAWARHAVACFWIRRGDGGSVRILPDACTDIVWRAGREAMIAGPDSRAWMSPTAPGEVILGARLLPGAGGPALGVPLAELRDRRVPVDALGLAGPAGLRNAAAVHAAAGLAHDAAGAPGAVDPLGATAGAAALIRVTLRLVATAPPDRAVQAASVRLLDPRQRVDELAASLGFSERQLHRRFLAAVGYGPKTLQRVLRLRRFLAAAGGADGLAGAAIDAGYADQAHLARECRSLTGLTPRDLAGPRRAHR